jgi:hypothetical protein
MRRRVESASEHLKRRTLAANVGGSAEPFGHYLCVNGVAPTPRRKTTGSPIVPTSWLWATWARIAFLIRKLL